MTRVKMIVLIGLAALGAVYAGSGPEKMTREEKNKAVVRRAIEAENRGDWELWKKLVTEEYVLHTPDEWEPKKRDDVELDARIRRRDYHDGRCVVEDIIAEGDRVAVRLKLVAMCVKGGFGMSEQAKEIWFTEIDILRLADGKIVEEWAEYDRRSLKGLGWGNFSRDGRRR